MELTNDEYGVLLDWVERNFIPAGYAHTQFMGFLNVFMIRASM